MDQLLQQAPAHVTVDEAKAALEKCNNNVVDAIALLWKVPAPETKPTDKWQEIRDICSAHENAMKNLLKDSQSQKM
jgi:hypothetical protein